MRRVTWGIFAVVMATLAVEVIRPFDLMRAEAGPSNLPTRPYVLASPFYQPKTGTNATLHFTNMDDVVLTVNLRRYNAVGGLLSSTNLNVQAKATIIAFAGANSGAQMHVEAWTNSPYFTLELIFTDTASVTQKIPYSEMLKPFVGSGFVALDGIPVCNTRNDGNPTPCEGAKLGSGATRTITIAGMAGLPSTLYSSVELLAQVENASSNSYLTFFPAGSPRPSIKHVNFTAGSWTRASDQVTVKIPASAQLSIYNNLGTTDLVLRVVGYYL